MFNKIALMIIAAIVMVADVQTIRHMTPDGAIIEIVVRS